MGQRRLPWLKDAERNIGAHRNRKVTHDPVDSVIGAQAARADSGWPVADPALEHADTGTEYLLQLVEAAPRAVVVPREDAHVWILVKTEPDGVHVQLDVLSRRLDALDDALHGFIAEIEVVGALDKERRVGGVAVKCFQHEAQAFFLAVYLTIDRGSRDGLVEVRILKVSRDTEFGIDRDAYLRRLKRLHDLVRSLDYWGSYNVKPRAAAATSVSVTSSARAANSGQL